MTHPVPIPADVDRSDRVLADLTARQLTILAATALVLYLGWLAAHRFVAWPALVAAAIPLAATGVVLAWGTRDGLSLDAFVLAGLRHQLTPNHHVSTQPGRVPRWITANTQHTRQSLGTGVPESVPRTEITEPALGETTAAVLDLGADGHAIVASASTINFALRTPSEQHALVAGFARYLHALTGPVQILVRTEPFDLAPAIQAQRSHAAHLATPALQAAAHEHADYLTALAEDTTLLTRRILLVFREPHLPSSRTAGDPDPQTNTSRHRPHRPGGAERLARRMAEAVELLGPLGITVTPLEPTQARGVLTAACAPDRTTAAADPACVLGEDTPITGGAMPATAQQERNR